MIMIPIVYCKYELKFPYYVCDDGNVYSEIAHKNLSWQKDKDGYAKVQMISTDEKRHRYSVHRLILENFNPRQDMANLQVNHIEKQHGEHNPSSKLTEEDVLKIIELLQTQQYTGKQISKMFGVTDDYANAIRRKERWTYLTKDIDFN